MALAPLTRLPASCAALLTAALLVGCGPSTPEATSPSPTAEPSTSAAPAASASSAAAPTASPTAPPSAEPVAPAPAKPGVLAADSVPAGVTPLTDVENKELEGKCKKVVDTIAAMAKKGGSKKRPIDYVAEVVAAPPKIPGVDVPRCAALISRQLTAYMAATRENEAKVNLKRIVVGFMSALEATPPAFCASASPVPPSLDTVKDLPYVTASADWSAEGWKCVRFDLAMGPQVFQYELRTDPKTKSFEAIARGYPVRGAAPTELYVTGKVENGAIDPSMPVMRR